MISEQDIRHMKRCLELAAKAAGRTSPNPMVGALVTDCRGQVIGEGCHEKAGLPHAEVVALDQAGEDARGGTLYVTFEPCCHYGKTPPCSDRVIASGVSRVVAGMVDPNPRVSGQGIKALRESGCQVEVGVLERECRWLNRGFVKVMNNSLPWLCLKLASTLDGKIADRTGSSRWISGEEARAYVHELRNLYDCVLIGGHTACLDDPELTVRNVANSRNPLRAIVDTELAISPDARVCLDESAPTIIFCSPEAYSRRGKAFPGHVRLIASAVDPAGGLKLADVLSLLAGQGVLTVFCEGGGRLAAGLLSKNLVDEICWIASPKILADELAVPAIAGLGQVMLSQAIEFKQVSVSQLGRDVLIQGILPGLLLQ